MTQSREWTRIGAAVTAVTLALAATATAEEAGMPNVGDEAPEFTVIDHERNEVSLSSFLGEKHVVLAFYPLAFTGG